MADARARRVLALAWPYIVVALLALGLLWPSPFAGPPRSADHVVHLARVQMWADILAQGQLRAWSWGWFFGAPIGELYPPLGDMLVITVKGLSLGLMSWAQAYAWAFALVMGLQGWVLVTLARRTGLGALAGVVAATFVLLDPGFTREGGWMYTVYFGVWPQVLSTSLCWLGLAWLVQHDEELVARPGLAALAWGLAILAHPIALPVGVLMVGTWVLFALPREGLGTHVIRTGLVAAAALGLAAWWLLPMLEHRAWMASYGWLFAPLSKLLEWLGQGHWAQRMPGAVGYAALMGVLWALVRGSRYLRAIAILGVGLWLMTASDVFWGLRLDRLSEGFTHIQYQRFIIAAKPALALLAAWVGTAPLLRAWPALRDRDLAQVGRLGGVAAALALGLCGWMVVQSVQSARAHDVGKVQMHRGYAGVEVADADFVAAMRWLEDRADTSPDFWRVAYRAPRNVHWFMDATSLAPLSAYKVGFTPGDNFVHKPESGARAVLDVLRVRYVVRRIEGKRAQSKEVARFGDLRIIERELRSLAQGKSAGNGPMRARVLGPGELELLEQADTQLRVKVSKVTAKTQIVFDTAGHPDWKLYFEGEPLAWDEVPAWGHGPAATPEDRALGLYRGGKANGDTGKEPILIRATPPRAGELELRFEPGSARSLAALLISLCTVLIMAWAWRRQRTWTLGWAAPVQRAAAEIRPVHLWIALGAVTLLAGLRWLGAKKQEAPTVLAWTESPGDVQLGPVKTQMLIRPALLFTVRPGAPTRTTLDHVPCGQALTGWIAIDDDVGKQRKGKLARTRYTMTFFTEGLEPATHSAAHRPGQTYVELPALACEGFGTIEVEAQHNGEHTQTVGLWLQAQDATELGGPPS